ncbi:hypothetical protein XM38_034210 [Halomicronema hongdechloris C2206]|uniref:HTH merR-type domain-containing protein n=1 Tax=Halomicronema hongdechloris C2206 TaxID=1641165 RepID=A0A1Z3HQ71_9CYAN|nr:hypothetical protein [Halomicronema hongdechloris]ASC72464.1 hypothetical protein XM38_034210 [Halomicronema hongdechloris C2206]
MEQFTRRETLILAKTTLGRLTYLAKTGIVVPQLSQQTRPPMLLYSWEQVLEVRAITYLRRHASLQAIRKIVTFLNDNGFDCSLRNKHLVVSNDEVNWVMPNNSGVPQIMHMTGRNQPTGQLVLAVLPPLSSIIQDVWETARTSNVIDFEHFKQRAKLRE